METMSTVIYATCAVLTGLLFSVGAYGTIQTGQVGLAYIALFFGTLCVASTRAAIVAARG